MKWLFVQGAGRTEMLVSEMQHSEPVVLPDMDTEARRRSHVLFGLFAAMLKREGRSFRPSEDRNGCEARGAVKPLQRLRGLSPLEASTSPRGWPLHIDDYMDSARDVYEARCKLFEQVGGKRLDDDIKIATLGRNAPEEVKIHFRLRADGNTTYTMRQRLLVVFRIGLRLV